MNIKSISTFGFYLFFVSISGVFGRSLPRLCPSSPQARDIKNKKVQGIKTSVVRVRLPSCPRLQHRHLRASPLHRALHSRGQISSQLLTTNRQANHYYQFLKDYDKPRNNIFLLTRSWLRFRFILTKNLLWPMPYASYNNSHPHNLCHLFRGQF